jgi:SNF2 family DNA or RNA helicase
MSKEKREANIQKFSTSSCSAFLVSLKVGAYGLNLTCANHVILVDPWWNPAVEEQAIERVHRLG